MAATYVQQVGPGAAAAAKSATVTMPVTAPTTAGNAIIVVCSDSLSSSMSIQSCTDTKGNSYTLVVNNIHSTAFVQQAIFIARGAAALTTADTITVTASTANGQPAVTAFEFSGITGDSDAVTTGQGNSVSTFDTGAVAVPSGGHLLFSVATGTGARAFTSTGVGTWITLPSPPNPSANIRTLTPWYQIVSGGGTLENLGTIDSSTNSMSSAAAFPAGSTSTNVTVTGVLATAAATGLAGTVTATKTVTVAGARASATAAAPNGSVTAGRGVTVAGPVASASASAPAGSFTAAGGVTVGAPTATATAAAPVGTVQANRSVTVVGPLATVTATALAGSAAATADVILAGLLATATAHAPAGSFGAVSVPPHDYGFATLAGNGQGLAVLAGNGQGLATLAVQPLNTAVLHTTD